MYTKSILCLILLFSIVQAQVANAADTQRRPYDQNDAIYQRPQAPIDPTDSKVEEFEIPKDSPHHKNRRGAISIKKNDSIAVVPRVPAGPKRPAVPSSTGANCNNDSTSPVEKKKFSFWNLFSFSKRETVQEKMAREANAQVDQELKEEDRKNEAMQRSLNRLEVETGANGVRYGYTEESVTKYLSSLEKDIRICIRHNCSRAEFSDAVASLFTMVKFDPHNGGIHVIDHLADGQFGTDIDKQFKTFLDNIGEKGRTLLLGMTLTQPRDYLNSPGHHIDIARTSRMIAEYPKDFPRGIEGVDVAKAYPTHDAYVTENILDPKLNAKTRERLKAAGFKIQPVTDPKTGKVYYRVRNSY